VYLDEEVQLSLTTCAMLLPASRGLSKKVTRRFNPGRVSNVLHVGLWTTNIVQRQAIHVSEMS